MKHWIIQISVDRQPEANAFCKTIAPEGGEFTFTNKLLDGADQVIAYWCCWNMDEKTETDIITGMPYAEFREFFDGENEKGTKITGEEYLAEKHLKVTELAAVAVETETIKFKGNP